MVLNALEPPQRTVDHTMWRLPGVGVLVVPYSIAINWHKIGIIFISSNAGSMAKGRGRGF
jgi:hypothetical protein